MPINFEEILNFVQILSEQKSLRATVDKSVKGACITGGFTLVGSLLGGPAGLLIGGILGTGVAYASGKGTYSSVPYIIANEMTEIQKIRLAESIYKVVKDIDATDAAMLLKIVMTNSALEGLVIQELCGYFKNQLGYSIAA